MRMVGIGAVLVLVAGLLGAGCSGNRKKISEDPFFENWRARAERSKGYTPTRKKYDDDTLRRKLGAEKRAELLAEKVRPLPTRRVTVKLRELDVSMVLRAVAKAVDQNIIINEAVTGTVSVDVKNVPWNQVFTGILKTQGLAYEWEGDIIRVMSAADQEQKVRKEIETVIVPIDFADAAKLKDNLQKILSSNVAAAEEPTTAVKQPGAATPSPEAAKKAEALAGTVLVDEHNNALIIQSTRTEIQRLLPLIEALDRPTPQILIEAHIVEANKTTARQLGIQWGGLYGDKGQWIYPGVNSSGTTGTTQGVGVAPTSNWGINFPAFTSNLADTTAALPTGMTLGYMIGGGVGENMLAAQLTALQSDGVLHILSSPSITTMDQREASIESGREVPYQTVDENGRVVVNYKKAVLKLTVKPSVVDKEVLKLNIQTQKDEVDFTNSVQGNPTLITKNAKTEVVLRDGETTVIGGLNVENEVDEDAGIPGLKDIPLLGYLFKADSKSRSFDEILIFITPYVLKERPAEGS
jgi:type IV pilus assembly protein PilQ